MKTRRIRSVVTVAAMTAAMTALAGPAMAEPAMADDGISERLENRLENRAERVENFYDNHGFGVDIDVEDDGSYYSPFVNPFYYGWGFYGADVDIDDGELEIDLD